MEGGAGAGGRGGGGAAELRRRMAAQRAACQQQIAAARDRAAVAASSFHQALLSARFLAHHSLSHRVQLTGLKDRLRELEADLAEALSVRMSKESKYELISESISRTATSNEQLKSLLADQRTRRDEYAVVVSNQLEALEALEANSNEDATGRKTVEEAIMWYNKFLGFQVVGGEGVKFVFNKIDPRSPEKEYLFCIKLDKERYNLLQCDLYVKDSEELMKDLNRTNDLFKFVRIMRERFQAAATANGILPESSILSANASSITVASPPVRSINTRSENTPDQSHSQRKSKSQALPAKRGAPARSAASPGTVVSSLRRSPRFAGIR